MLKIRRDAERAKKITKEFLKYFSRDLYCERKILSVSSGLKSSPNLHFG